ncbi:RNA polymerase sigma factor [Enhygromyxa salina]|nr:RNA polymerase sigma factor [Enhygromyxa salina]
MTHSDEREAAFERFVATHYDRAVRFAWRLSGAGNGVAEELAQEAFVVAYDKRLALRDPAALEGWFFRILARRAANHRRWSAVRTRFARSFVPEPSPAPNPPEPALRARIGAAMDQLSEAQRAVFVLVYLEGFTLDQAAEMLDKAPGTVRTHLHRALKTLRSELAEVMAELD